MLLPNILWEFPIVYFVVAEKNITTFFCLIFFIYFPNVFAKNVCIINQMDIFSLKNLVAVSNVKINYILTVFKKYKNRFINLVLIIKRLRLTPCSRTLNCNQRLCWLMILNDFKSIKHQIKWKFKQHIIIMSLMVTSVTCSLCNMSHAKNKDLNDKKTLS